MLSIVIPTYNRAGLLPHTVRSALASMEPHDELVIRDNCSSDTTQAVVQGLMKEDSRIIFLEATTNEGPVENWLHVINKAHGDLVVLLFSDDVLIPEQFKEFREQFVESSHDVGFGAAIIGAEIGKASPEFVVAGAGPQMSKNQYLRHMLTRLGSVPVSPAAYIFKRERLVQCLLMAREEFKSSRDAFMTGAGIDLLTVAFSATTSSHCFYRETPHVFFRQHAASMSTAKEQVVQALYRSSRVALARKNFGPISALAAALAYGTAAALRSAKKRLFGAVTS